MRQTSHALAAPGYGSLFKREIPIYKNVHDKAVRKSRRLVDRRLVLPKEEGNWSRALEVVQAPFTRRGVTPHHWHNVVREAGAHANAEGQHRTLHTVFEKIMAKEIAWTPGLVHSIATGYCSIGAVDDALDVLSFAGRHLKGAAEASSSPSQQQPTKSFPGVGNIPTAMRNAKKSRTSYNSPDRLPEFGSRQEDDGSHTSHAKSKFIQLASHYKKPTGRASVPVSDLLGITGDIIRASAKAGSVDSAMSAVEITEQAIMNVVRGSKSSENPTEGERHRLLQERKANYAHQLQQLLSQSDVVTALAEANARQGNWRLALGAYKVSGLVHPNLQNIMKTEERLGVSKPAAAVPVATPSTKRSPQRLASIRALFEEDTRSTPKASASPVDKEVSIGGNAKHNTAQRETVQQTELSELSAEAQRNIAISAGMSGQWSLALEVLRQQQQNHRSTLDSRDALLKSCLNGLGMAGRWSEAVQLLQQCIPSAATSGRSPAVLDSKSLDLVLMAMSSSTHSAAIPCAPETLIEFFDELSFVLDDLPITSCVASSVGTALLAVDHQWERCLHLVGNCEDLTSKSNVVKNEGSRADPSLRKVIDMVYHLHALGVDAQLHTLVRFPFLFPKETFNGLPKDPKEIRQNPEAAKQVLLERQKRREGHAATSSSRALSNSSKTQSGWKDVDVDGERFVEALAEQERSRPIRDRRSVVRPGRHQYFKQGEKKRQSYFEADYLGADVAGTAKGGFGKESPTEKLRKNARNIYSDPNATPRAAPKDQADGASGWNYYHNLGGLPYHEGSKRVPSVLSSWPKQMKALSNPYRSWNPNLNSSHAHKQSVRKWSGRTSL